MNIRRENFLVLGSFASSSLRPFSSSSQEQRRLCILSTSRLCVCVNLSRLKIVFLLFSKAFLSSSKHFSDWFFCVLLLRFCSGRIQSQIGFHMNVIRWSPKWFDEFLPLLNISFLFVIYFFISAREMKSWSLGCISARFRAEESLFDRSWKGLLSCQIMSSGSLASSTSWD